MRVTIFSIINCFFHPSSNTQTKLILNAKEGKKFVTEWKIKFKLFVLILLLSVRFLINRICPVHLFFCIKPYQELLHKKRDGENLSVRHVKQENKGCVHKRRQMLFYSLQLWHISLCLTLKNLTQNIIYQHI